MNVLERFIKDNWFALLIAGVGLLLYWCWLSAREDMKTEREGRLTAEAEADSLRDEKHQLQIALLEQQRCNRLWARGLQIGKALAAGVSLALMRQHGHS
jgi:hypothetical protein